MKKLLVVLSLVMVLAFAGSSFAASVGHISYEEAQTIANNLNAQLSENTTAAQALADLLENALNNQGYATVGSENFSSAATTQVQALVQTLRAGGNASAEEIQAAVVACNVDLTDLLVALGLSAADITAAVDPVRVAVATVVDIKTWKSKGLTGLTFYPQISDTSIVAASDVMWLEYTTNGTTFTRFDPANASSVSDDASFVIVFLYNADPATGGVGKVVPTDWTGKTPVTSVSPVIVPTFKASGGDTPVDDDNTVGGSGGGCVAGTSALALAVLGMFIAKGKK